MDQLAEVEACRICVTCYPLKDMDFIYIFHKSEEFQRELDFIQGEIRQWQLKINENDGLPQRICADCFAKFCSIEAFRKECELAQEKLFQTVMQEQQEQDKEVKLNQPPPLVQDIIKQDTQQQQQTLLHTIEGAPLPLVGGDFASRNAPLDGEQQALVSSVTLAQTDVALNDYRVYDDQQFDHYDNPALLDASATLLDNHLITSEPSNELGFLPSQNLFTFETAEPPCTGTLPLVETETASIMGGIIDNGGEQLIKNNDLEDMLQRNIILTNTTNSTITTNQKNAKLIVTRTTAGAIHNKGKTVTNSKTDVKEIYNTNDIQTDEQTLAKCEDNTSDNECDDSNVNNRLKGLPYTCHYCYCPDTGPIDHLNFPDEDALSQHFFDIHDPNRPYTCPHCENSYKTQRLRDNHVRLVHESYQSHKCNFCQKNLRGPVEIHQYHCQHVADWECAHCKEKFPNTPLYRFRLHQRQHERGKNFKCGTCERSFMRKANLDAHERIHKNETKSQWHCQTCNANFQSNYDLRRHNYQQHDDESPVKCKECNQGFSSIAFLQRHIAQIHNTRTVDSATTAANVHVCSKCNASFPFLENLQKHTDEANNNNGVCKPSGSWATYDFKERRRIQRQGVFPCFLCPKRFHLRSQLDKHLNTHDARLRPYQCQQCFVRCRTAIELKQHVNVSHLNIKAFACEKCGKSFGYKKDLRDHMLFHAEISVVCTEEGCDYVCKNEKALMDHIRHKHRLLSCEYCHEEFTRQKLTIHLRNVHRAEIDVELAGETDNFYKSQLLNNNNDIKQISFNLINTQIASNTNSTAISSSTSSSALADANISTTGAQASSSTSTSSSIISPNASPIASYNTNNNNNTNNHYDHNQQQPSLPTIFVTDHNSNNLALNGFVSSPQLEMNLVGSNDANTMYVVSTGSTSSMENDNNLDQYFMSSLMDTEQEIIVT